MIVFEPIAIGAYRGWIAPPFAGTILDWMRGERDGITFKRGPTRDVIRLEGSPPIYVKRLRNDAGLVGRFASRGLVRARREFQNLTAAAERGIPAPKPVALLVGDTDALLATQAVPDSIVLKSLLAGRPLSREEFDSLIPALGELVRALSEAGIEHDELDTAHVMIGREFPARLTVIDMESARSRSRPLAAAETLRMAARLSHTIAQNLPAQEGLRLARAMGYGTREAQRGLLGACRKVAWASVRGRARRALTGGPGFYIEEPGRSIVHASRGLPIEKVLEHLRRLLTAPRIKRLARREVARTDPDTAAKVFRYPGMSGALRRGLADEPGARTWFNAHLLLACGVPTPEPLALVSDPDRTVYFHRWLRDATPLGDWIRAVFPGWDRARRRAFLRRVARLVRRMHDWGLFHRDLKANNILVHVADDGPERLYVVDLDRVRHAPTISRESILTNLAQLNASVGAPLSKTDRACFLRAYIGWNRPLAAERKKLAAEIQRLTARRNHVYRP